MFALLGFVLWDAHVERYRVFIMWVILVTVGGCGRKGKQEGQGEVK
jgi:hypothetical protein